MSTDRERLSTLEEWKANVVPKICQIHEDVKLLKRYSFVSTGVLLGFYNKDALVKLVVYLSNFLA